MLATAALLTAFGLAMVGTVGIDEVGRYAVVAQIGALLVASARGARPRRAGSARSCESAPAAEPARAGRAAAR